MQACILSSAFGTAAIDRIHVILYNCRVMSGRKKTELKIDQRGLGYETQIY